MIIVDTRYILNSLVGNLKLAGIFTDPLTYTVHDYPRRTGSVISLLSSLSIKRWPALNIITIGIFTSDHHHHNIKNTAWKTFYCWIANLTDHILLDSRPHLVKLCRAGHAPRLHLGFLSSGSKMAFPGYRGKANSQSHQSHTTISMGGKHPARGASPSNQMQPCMLDLNILTTKVRVVKV